MRFDLRRLLGLRNLLLLLGVAMFIHGVVRAGPGVWPGLLLPPRHLGEIEMIMGAMLMVVWWAGLPTPPPPVMLGLLAEHQAMRLV